MHLLPRVAELEERFADVLEVVGVHSGKFVTERRTDGIRDACARLGVRHAVVNDRQFRTWRSYGVQAWPTVALITPDGYVAGQQAGEWDVEPMAEAVAALAARYESQGMMRRGPLDLGADPNRPREPEGALRFPSRVIAQGDRLYVSDAGHHRVLELRLEGPAQARIARVFGDGVDGYRDGGASEVRFREPQGLALHGETLLVADRRAHALRAVALADGSVTTLAGTGELGGYRIAEGDPSTPLRSPWGLGVLGREALIGMAGSHQLWGLDLGPGGGLRLVAGSGGENIVDGRGAEAALAQPSGVATSSDGAYFADAETSAVRRLGEDGSVSTLVGTDLFEFGDRDGRGDAARLQHCLDVALVGGRLLVADTYNSKLKWVDPGTRECIALPGAAGSGEDLREPGGVHAGPEGVFVADTNHHRIVRVDVETGGLSDVRVG